MINYVRIWIIFDIFQPYSIACTLNSGYNAKINPYRRDTG